MGKSLSGKELGKGITQRKNGLYEAKFINRFGKRQTLYGKTVTEITRKLREAQYLDEKQINVADSKMTLDEWFEIWITTCKKNCRNTTKRTYTNQYNRIREELGWRRLTSLNLVTIQQAFNILESDASREACRAVLVDILNRAVESDLIMKNAALGVNTKIDGKLKEERRILSEAQSELLLKAIPANRYMYALVMLALNTGMRIGEILGLCWDCVDFQAGNIHIKRTLIYLPNNGEAIYEFHIPKTAAGTRTIPMTKEVKGILLQQKLRQNRINHFHPPVPGFEDLVFTSKTNRPIHETNVRKQLYYYADLVNEEYPEAGMERFSAHCLRHTFATWCIAKGMKPKVLQKILGHTSLQMTMDLYCHVEDETIRDEMALIAELA